MADCSPEEQKILSFRVLEHFKRQIPIPQKGHVAGYSPIKNECSPLPVLEHLHHLHCPLALPVVLKKNHELAFRAWHPGDALEAGLLGIPEPKLEADTVYPSVLLVPMIGFDHRGFRLGHGGGFYDRTIEMLRKSQPILCVGIAYHFQKSENLPSESHDCRMDYIVTDKEVLAFS